MLSRWADEVPADFAFTLKAPRRITHDKRLKDTAAEVGELLRRAARLGSKLGPLLFQLPPSQRKDLAVLGDFLDGLPRPPDCFRVSSSNVAGRGSVRGAA